MATAPPPPKAPNGPPPRKQEVVKKDFSVSKGVSANQPHRIVIYGPGGVGKTELCSLMTKANVKPLFVDLEHGTRFLDVDRIDSIETFDDLRSLLQSDIVDGYDAVVIDTLTAAEELALPYVLENVPKEKGGKAENVESYGWGKGYIHMLDAFRNFLGDLDAICRKGKHVVCIAHDCTASVPNPGGEDYIRYEPRLQARKDASIRHKVKEWCDHLLYVGFDTSVKDGRAIGSGSRTIYPTEMPTHWAKSRFLTNTIVYEKGDATLWQLIFNSNKQGVSK